MHNEVLLNKLGIGDLFIFCVCFLNEKNTNKLTYSISNKVLSLYRNKTEVEYSEFCKNLLNFFFEDTEINLEFSLKQDLNPFLINENMMKNLFQKAIKNEYIIEHFKKKFFKRNEESNYIVLQTKARDYEYNKFAKIKNDFFNLLNQKNKKIIIIGEKEVEYNREYSIHGSNKIYSLYNEIINSVDNSLIVDLTVPKLGVTVPKLENILRDMSIIYQSNAFINIGGGGFFCLSLVNDKLISIHNPEHILKTLPDFINDKIFLDSSLFLNKIERIK